MSVVFENDRNQFAYERTTSLEGRDLLEYSFSCSLADRRYQVKAGHSWLHVPYHGGFQLDPVTADVVGLSLATGDLPEVMQMCQAATTVRLGKASVAGSEFILPKATI